jgi:hypothetical protein
LTQYLVNHNHKPNFKKLQTIMKNLSILFYAAIAFVALTVITSCKKISGEGPIVVESRDITGFVAIKSGSPADIFLAPGPDYKVEIESQQNIIDAIETVVKDRTLEIREKHGIQLKPKQRIKVYITAPDVQSLAVHGSGNIDVTRDFIGTHLDLKIKGSGSINVPYLEVDRLYADISGSGDIRVQDGAVQAEELTISGSGDMTMPNLEAKNAEARISGSGNIRLFATDHLKVRISGSGNVYYRGTPTIDVEISGSGSLKRM